MTSGGNGPQVRELTNRKRKPHSKETKEKCRVSKLGNKNPWFGKKLPINIWYY